MPFYYRPGLSQPPPSRYPPSFTVALPAYYHLVPSDDLKFNSPSQHCQDSRELLDNSCNTIETLTWKQECSSCIPTNAGMCCRYLSTVASISIVSVYAIY
ncbi:hypothetical protein K474DRAFT_1659016 [Panus rudis PR-1116 ss-1]|nr:hypothetical protein K474DRAFT_1659016 [Panus rudis PR-1116 ss-1]